MKRIIIAAILVGVVGVIGLVILGQDDNRVSQTSSVRAEASQMATSTPVQTQELIKDNWAIAEIVDRGGEKYLVFNLGVGIEKGEALLKGDALEALDSVKVFDRVFVSYYVSDGPLVVTQMSKVRIIPPCSGTPPCGEK